MGRYWAMDRDHRWERVAIAYEAMTGRQTSHPLEEAVPTLVTSRSAIDAVESY